MFDARLRSALAPALDTLARAVDVPWVTPNRLTGLNLVAGLLSAVLAATQQWIPALILWLLCRIADGLDGPLARRRAGESCPSSGQGGFWDICADFVVYGATVVGVAIGATAAFDAPWLPFLLVLLAYYINGGAFLAFSSIAEKQGRALDDGRSLSLIGGLTEGVETVLVHSLWLIFPFAAASIIELLSLREGDQVLDLGCGTGLNLSQLQQRVGPSGHIVGIDRSAQMLAQARRRAQRHGWENVTLVRADATEMVPSEISEEIVQAGGQRLSRVGMATYSLSLMGRWDQAWTNLWRLTEPGAELGVLDMQRPIGPSALLSPMGPGRVPAGRCRHRGAPVGRCGT